MYDKLTAQIWLGGPELTAIDNRSNAAKLAETPAEAP
jgi:hypothetical protein